MAEEDGNSEEGEPEPLSIKLGREGLSKLTFFFGVTGFLGVIFIFGRWPWHLWLVLFAGYFVLPPLWYIHVMKFRKGHLFILDLCWVASIVFMVYLGLTLAQVMDESQRLWAFRTFFVYGAGFLSWSIVALGNQVVFYSNERMAIVFVHVMPCLVTLGLREGSDLSPQVKQMWPGYFPEGVWADTDFYDLFLAGVVPYLMWWVPYTFWLLCIGLEMPGRGYMTVFSELHRKLKPFAVKYCCKEERAHAVIYMTVHFVLCCLSYVWAMLVFWSYLLHWIWVCIVLIFAIWSGSMYYINVTVKKFGPLLKSQDMMAKEGGLELPALGATPEGQKG